MTASFASQIFSEKLSKLNDSQQSIETLSHWCIFHRKNAKQVVEIWEREFFASPRERRVPFLFLANDILQNSRRKGGEFVNEFWKVLPTALREVLGSGEDSIHGTIFRLVEIWEERKVFGSRAQNLREELLGHETFSTYGNQKPMRTPVKLFQRKEVSLEKVTAAYQAVQEIFDEEDLTFAKCKATVSRINRVEKETQLVDGLVSDHSMFEELQQLHVVLSQCIEQFEASEMSRLSLISRLKEVIHDQESRLDQIRVHLQKAQAHSEQIGELQQQLMAGNPRVEEVAYSPEDEFRSDSRQDTSVKNHEYHFSTQTLDESHGIMTGDSLPSTEPSNENSGFLEHDNSNHPTPSSAAAEVAAKLAASTSSAQMLSSILSTLAAEGIHSSFSNGADSQNSPMNCSPVPQEKRQKLDGTADLPPWMDVNTPYIPHQISPLHQQAASPQPPPPAMQHQSLPPQPRPITVQHQPPPPPLPPFMGTTMSGNLYEYSSGGMPPPPRQVPPFPSLPRVSMFAPLPVGCNPGTYQPLQSPGANFYSQPPLPPPLPRQ